MVCNIPIKIIRWLEGCYQSLLLLNDSSCCPRSSSWPAPSSCAGLRTRCWPWWQCLGSVSPSVPSSLSCPTSWPSRLCCGTPSSSSFTIPWSVQSNIMHNPIVSPLYHHSHSHGQSESVWYSQIRKEAGKFLYKNPVDEEEEAGQHSDHKQKNSAVWIITSIFQSLISTTKDQITVLHLSVSRCIVIRLIKN